MAYQHTQNSKSGVRVGSVMVVWDGVLMPCCNLKLVRAGKWPKQMNNNIQQAVPRFFLYTNNPVPWLATPKTQNLACGCGASWCSEVASWCHVAISSLSELANGPNKWTITFSELYHVSSWAKTLCCHGLPAHPKLKIGCARGQRHGCVRWRPDAMLQSQACQSWQMAQTNEQ